MVMCSSSAVPRLCSVWYVTVNVAKCIRTRTHARAQRARAEIERSCAPLAVSFVAGLRASGTPVSTLMGPLEWVASELADAIYPEDC